MAELPPPDDQDFEDFDLFPPQLPYFNLDDLMQDHEQDIEAALLLQPHGQDFDDDDLLENFAFFNPFNFHRRFEQEILLNPELFQHHEQYIGLQPPHEQGLEAAELDESDEDVDDADLLQPHEHFQGLPLPNEHEHDDDDDSSQGRVAEWVVVYNDNDPEENPEEEERRSQSVIDKFGILREPLRYYFKFGAKGSSEGQFNEPSAIAVNSEDILVADTENNRIQTFTSAGMYRYEFGRQDDDVNSLICPNGIAVEPTSGEIIVSQRYPCSDFKIYSPSGQFLRQFRLDDLPAPRCITVDSERRIIVVSWKTTKVAILNYSGTILHQFACSFIKCPKNVVVNEKQEIFITDTFSHCVYVFHYSGQCLRKIGRKGIINFPIGVLINKEGEVIIADNNHAFNVTIFNQDGTFLRAYKSSIQRGCMGIALLYDQVTLLCKESGIYLYNPT